ncbi:MAG: hypothetical protein R2823_03125 [Acidimicrobiia bacterium]
MSIEKALTELYGERNRLGEECARIDEAIAALESVSSTPPTRSKTRSKTGSTKRDGRSAPKPPVACPFCGGVTKGMVGLSAHVRGSHPDKYPKAYEAWKQSQS